MRRRLPLVGLAVFIVLLAGWAFWPLWDREWDIFFDNRLLAGKEAYLDGLGGHRYPDKRPNVVLIVADDLGLTDISLYGGTAVATPRIDSIGTEGVTFYEGYSTAPICAPSRAGLLTGRYQNRYGFDSQPMTRYAQNRFEFFVYHQFINTEPMVTIRNDSIPRPSQVERQGLPPSEITMAEALGATGYQTAVVGKWHLGYGDLQHPNNRGFDSFFGFLEAFSWFIDPEDPDTESHQFDFFSEEHIWKMARKGHSAVQRDGVVIEENEHLTDAFAREAVRKIEDFAADPENPFFLYVPFSAPHTPFQALKSYTEMFSHIADPRKRVYYGMIAQLDDAVGRILDSLDEAGIADETLVVFTSDNGGATYTGATGNDPLKGGKMSHFEGGLAVPFAARWPGVLAPGAATDTPVIHTDIFATILNAASVPPPPDRPVDGRDLRSLLADDVPQRDLFWRADYNHIVRSGRWKLLRNEFDGSLRLYDLEVDREERRNLAEERSDIVEKLEKLFDEWNRDMKAPAWPRVMNYRFEEDGEVYWFAI